MSGGYRHHDSEEFRGPLFLTFAGESVRIDGVQFESVPARAVEGADGVVAHVVATAILTVDDLCTFVLICQKRCIVNAMLKCHAISPGGLKLTQKIIYGMRNGMKNL